MSNLTIDTLAIALPEVVPHSFEEAQLFVSGVLAHLVMNLPLTDRVGELRHDLKMHPEFKTHVLSALERFESEGTLSNAGRLRLNDFLSL